MIEGRRCGVDIPASKLVREEDLLCGVEMNFPLFLLERRLSLSLPFACRLIISLEWLGECAGRFSIDSTSISWVAIMVVMIELDINGQIYRPRIHLFWYYYFLFGRLCDGSRNYYNAVLPLW